MKQEKYYMHTLNNHPAVFEGQICYAGRKLDLLKTATSLNQIRKEQKLSAKYRKEKFNEDEPKFTYGYILLTLEV